jgi:hypothetical protein
MAEDVGAMETDKTISSDNVETGEAPATEPAPATAPEAAPAAAEEKMPPTPWGWIGTMAGLFLLTLCVFAPWDWRMPPIGEDELDSSWAAVLQWAHVHDVEFGKQIVFTHGPWGVAAQGFFAGSAGGVAVVWLLVCTSCFLGLAKVARVMSDTKWVAGLFLAAAILLIGPPINIVDARFFLPCWLLLLIHFYVDDRDWTVEKVLLAGAMGVAGYFKFSLFFAALPVVTVITIDQLKRKRIPSTLVVYLISLAAFWIGAGQSIGNFGVYVGNSWMIASGYAAGVALNTPSEPFDVALFCLAAFSFMLALLLAHPAKKDENPDPSADAAKAAEHAAGVRQLPLTAWQSALGMAGAAALLFVDFKMGYVRHDVHEVAATGMLAIMAITASAALWARFGNGTVQIFLAVLSLGTVYLSWTSQVRFQLSGGPENLLAEVEEIPGRLGGMFSLLGNGPQQFDSGNASDRATLPNVDGTVDIYSWGQRQLLSQGMIYHPRPVFQSYLTFTQALSDLNARFLAGSGAAQTVLFDTETIDHHYLSEDDAASWPVLLTKYELVNGTGTYLVLRRSPQGRDFTLNPLESHTGRLGHWTGVPLADDPIWVKIQVHPTPLGRLAGLAYKPPVLLLGIKTASGDSEPFRFIPGVAEGGFLLSPRINERMGFGTLYSMDWRKQLASDLVTEMAVSTADSSNGESVCYDSEYDIQFFALHYPRTDVSSMPGMADYLSLRQLFSTAKFFKTEPNNPPKLVNSDDGKIVIKAPAETQMLIAIPPNTHGFRSGYGMMRDSWTANPPTDGVDFKIYAVDTELGKQLGAEFAWGVHSDPANVEGDRGLQHVTVQFPPGRKIYGLILETAPGGDAHRRSDSYWTDIQFK